MYKFKVGDRIVIVGNWYRGKFESATIIEVEPLTKPYGGDCAIEADNPIFTGASDPYRTGADFKDLVLENVYHSPLYKVMCEEE